MAISPDKQISNNHIPDNHIPDNHSPDQDVNRLALILLFMPFALWIILLIILPHIGMFTLSLTEKVAPRVYEYGPDNYINFATEPIYWNTLLRTGLVSLLVTFLSQRTDRYTH